MSHTIRAAVVSALLAVFPFSSSTVKAQEKGVAASAPVPSQISTGKKVFISNGGTDGIAYQAFRRLGDVNQPYDAFYSALNSWRKYTLVSTPCEADLVFEIRFTAPFNGDEHVRSYLPQLNLIIYDAKTRFVLWTILAPIEGAFRKTTFVRNVSQGIATLVADLKSLDREPVNSAPARGK